MSDTHVLLYSALPQKILGGIAVWTKTYIREAENHGIEYILVNNAAEGRRGENPEARISIIDELKRTIRIFRSLRKTLCSNEFNVAHLNTSCGPIGIIRDTIVAKIIRKKNIKVIVHFHCDIPFWVKSNISQSILERMVYYTDQLFVLCKNSEEYLFDNYGRTSRLIPNFIDPIYITSEKPINEICKRVLYVGGIQSDKGCLEIFSVAELIPEMEFIMVGQKSPEMENVKVPSNILFLGVLPHDEVIDVMDSCDVFLFPSHSEGFSLSLAEAMARGMPVVATNVGANAQMIESEGGIIVTVGDVDAMKNALLEMKNKNTREKCSRWNIEKVQNEYTTARVLEIIRQEYDALI